MTIENGPPYQFGRDIFRGEPVYFEFPSEPVPHHHHHFTCAHCGETFATETTKAEANREFLNSGQPMDGSGIKSVCDGCYEEIMTWAREKGILE